MSYCKSLLDKVKEITGKNVIPKYIHESPLNNGFSVFIDTDTIYVDTDLFNEYNLLFLIHEVGHWLEATDEQRLLPNIGLPIVDEENPPEEVLIREIRAREYSRLYFEHWANENLTGHQLDYVNYLFNNIFDDFEKDLDMKGILNQIREETLGEMV